MKGSFAVFEQVNVGERLEIEPSEAHDQVIGEMLKLDDASGDPCVGKDAFVVGRVDGPEKSWRHREERQMLDV